MAKPRFEHSHSKPSSLKWYTFFAFFNVAGTCCTLSLILKEMLKGRYYLILQYLSHPLRYIFETFSENAKECLHLEMNITQVFYVCLLYCFIFCSFLISQGRVGSN